MNTSRRLVRSSTDRIIGGVAGGIAHYLDIDPTLVRLGFVLLVLVGGISPFIYLILWAVMPSENSVSHDFGQQARENLVEMKQRATEVASAVSNQVSQIVGDQSKQVNQTPPTATSSSNEQSQHDGPATGPTTRL